AGDRRREDCPAGRPLRLRALGGPGDRPMGEAAREVRVVPKERGEEGCAKAGSPAADLSVPRNQIPPHPAPLPEGEGVLAAARSARRDSDLSSSPRPSPGLVLRSSAERRRRERTPTIGRVQEKRLSPAERSKKDVPSPPRGEGRVRGWGLSAAR